MLNDQSSADAYLFCFSPLSLFGVPLPVLQFWSLFPSHGPNTLLIAVEFQFPSAPSGRSRCVSPAIRIVVAKDYVISHKQPVHRRVRGTRARRTVILEVAQVVPAPSSSPHPGSHGHFAEAGLVTSRLYCGCACSHTAKTLSLSTGRWSTGWIFWKTLLK